jgi:ferredoxin-NADP reductase
VYINGRREERFYSLTHAPSEPHNTLTVAVQEVESGRVSSYLVNEAQVGTRLEISAAQGDFTLPAPSQRTQALLMLSAGSGITPVMAMLRELRQAGEATKVYHLHYARCAQDLIYAEALYEMQRDWANYQLDLNLTRGKANSGRTARWSPEQQQQSCPDWIHRPAWACGPDAWLQQLQEHWTVAGVSGQLQTERFYRSVTTAADDAGPAQAVQFSRSAVAANVATGTSLLDAAEQQGLNPAYGCRMGICHSCDCELISGQVRDLRSGEILAQPGQRIQPCVCTPISPIEIDL